MLTGNCVFSEIKSFEMAEKRVVVLSATASTGFNLHGKRTLVNCQQRNHITLEVGWSPELLLQQLGNNLLMVNCHYFLKQHFIIIKCLCRPDT